MNYFRRSLLKLGVKLQGIRYLNRQIVFASDLLLSGFASLAVFSILYRVLPSLVANISIYTLLGCSLLISAVLLYSFRAYRIVIRYSTVLDLTTFFSVAIVKSILLGALLMFHTEGYTPEGVLLFVLFDAALTVFLLFMFRSLLVSIYYSFIQHSGRHSKHFSRVLIYGMGEESSQMAVGISSQSKQTYKPVGLLEISEIKRKIQIHNLPVVWVANEQEFAHYVHDQRIDGIVFVSEEMLHNEATRLSEWCLEHGVDMFVMPTIERTNGEIKKRLREVRIEDLLGREAISIEMERIRTTVAGKCVLVSGAAGSIGSEIVRQLCKVEVRKLVCYDNAETPLHNLELEIRNKYAQQDVEFILGDVRSPERIEATFTRVRPNIVYHAAAYKHVPMIERNPCEAVLVNVMGTMNIANAATKHGVERFVMISTDKAVRPTNVMGATKRLAEMYVQALNHTESCKTLFITTRFGNVLGSNGSVIPLFRQQIANGGPLTVTHPDITRFFMTIPEACRLVLQASVMGEGGEIFVFDMGKSVCITDLAKRMIMLAGLKEGEDIQIAYTGLRPGEKLYEELLTEQESTTETQHGKIRRAAVTPSQLDTLEERIRRLIVLSQKVDIRGSVTLLKELVPDFISKNSSFEALDK